MALQLLGRWKVTDAELQGRAEAMSLFKGHSLSWRGSGGGKHMQGSEAGAVHGAFILAVWAG